MSRTAGACTEERSQQPKEEMKKFKVVSEYEPAGDQGEAIKGLVDGYNNGLNPQTLKGVTGSGKTYTMAKVIEKMQMPTLVISHNKKS